MKQKQVIISVVIVLAIIIGGIFLFKGGSSNSSDSGANKNTGISDNVVDWREFEFKDIRTQKTFKISDFKGKPILLESFAVWCPTCTQQQNEIKDLHEQVGDSIISISLDLDPNEDESKVLEHITRNGFTWYYSISPPEVTNSLKAEFGTRVLFAPGAPIIYIDESFNAKFLKRGVKSSEELLSEIGL